MEYFNILSKALKDHKQTIPKLIIDLDRLDKNIATLKSQINKESDFRLVVKSLPAPGLVEYILDQMNSSRLMVFHQPFLSQIAACADENIDILMGKPMPVSTAKYFYQNPTWNNAFNPYRQIQWLVDTNDRLEQYAELSKGLKQKLPINLEIDIGLHRGGFENLASMRTALEYISNNSELLEFSGFMGYDPHVVKLPKLIKSANKAFAQANKKYESFIQLVREEFPQLMSDKLCFNGGGSPSIALHKSGSPINEIAAGSALLKPTSFDIPSLSLFESACFIATPILKKLQGTNIPGIESFSNKMSWFNKTWRNAYFIYGGYWKADYVYPPDANENSLFGPSTNQSLVNSAMDLNVDEYIYLRPTQSEFVLLQFGKILGFRNGQIEQEWTVYSND